MTHATLLRRDRRIYKSPIHPAVLFLVGVNLGVCITGASIILWVSQ